MNDISKVKLQDGSVYNIKDLYVREQIKALLGDNPALKAYTDETIKVDNKDDK